MDHAIAFSNLQRLHTFADHRLSRDTDVHVFDIEKGPSASWTHTHCTSDEQLRAITDNRSRQADPRIRIISLHCPLTVMPLEVTKEDLIHLFQTYQINPLFADSIMAFGSPPNPEDGGSAPAVALSTGPSGSKGFECWYRLQYFEQNHRSTIDPWSPRHTAVYHKYSEPEGSSLILLLHPSDDSALERKLLQLDTAVQNDDTLRSLSENPIAIHVMISDIYLPNWRDHLRDHANMLRGLRDDIDDIDLTRQSSIEDMSTIRKLHRLSNVFSRSAMFCQGNSNILKKLQYISEVNQWWSPSQHVKLWLSTVDERAQDHAAGYRLLNDQVKDAIEHLQYAVAHKNQLLTIASQRTAVRLNQTLLDLTHNAADDGATIKVITILGLIYLPGSFVATVFGMDFFNFEGNELILGRNIWIFLAIWIPLTGLTVSIYLYSVWQRHKAKKMRKLKVDDDLLLQDNCIV